MAGLDTVDLVAVCDIDAEAAEAVADSSAEAASGSRPAVYTDYETMLAECKPDVVGIATPNRFHYPMTIQAADAGVKGVYCEKPIAVDLGEAREMVAECERRGVLLAVNHQRRLGPDFAWMRDQLSGGAIGEVYLVRGTCAGDMLSDGTHLIDSILAITGDINWTWVFAGLHRDETGGDEEIGGGFHAKGGWRFGHPVETGMFTVFELDSGLRCELLTGDLRFPKRPYHDIEVIGTEGALWRSGDKAEENLFERGAGGAWEPVKSVSRVASPDKITEGYRRLVDLIASGDTIDRHPLGYPFTMRGFELLMGAYESARTGTVISPPVTQQRYPLAVSLGLAE
jgi:predicted dehydrogenase